MTTKSPPSRGLAWGRTTFFPRSLSISSDCRLPCVSYLSSTMATCSTLNTGTVSNSRLPKGGYFTYLPTPSQNGCDFLVASATNPGAGQGYKPANNRLIHESIDSVIASIALPVLLPAHVLNQVQANILPPLDR